MNFDSIDMSILIKLLYYRGNYVRKMTFFNHLNFNPYLLKFVKIRKSINLMSCRNNKIL